MRDRYACQSDLVNYFKKKDLLGGLTINELAQLRANIGIMDYYGEGALPSPIVLSYSLFYDKITGNELITGALYEINDFLSIYMSNVYNAGGTRTSWGLTINPSQIYILNVRAISSNLIDKRVTIKGKKWEVEYDPTMEVLNDGVQTKGKITYLKDDNGNSAFYDFKNVRWLWTKETLNSAGILTNSDLLLYTFSNIQGGEVLDASELHNTKFNILLEDCYNNIFIGDTYYNIIGAESRNNLFAKGCHDSFIKWNSVNNRFNEPVCYLDGSIYNININTGNTVLSTTISKTVHKVNDATIVSYLDPITYSYQVVIL